MNARERLVPHRTRVVVRGTHAGMVIGVRNARRRLVGVGTRSRVEVPATVTVLLDSGRRVEAPLSDVVVEGGES